jgi:hypothetical protein
VPAYDAFVSYSHAKDKPVASALQAVIQKLGNDSDSALAAYEEALEIARRMAKACPNKEVWQQDVAETSETIEGLKKLGGSTAER